MSANSAAAGVTNVASAAATAPRAISGPGLTPACGFLNVPRTYSGDRSVIIRIPLLSGSMVKSSCSEAKLAVPVTLINAFSVSKQNLRSRHAVRNIEIRRRAVNPHFVIAKNLPDNIVADVQPHDFHQVAANQSIIHQ